MSTTFRALRRAIDATVEAEDAVELARRKLGERQIELGKALRDCREYRKLSLRECAKRVGVSAPYLSDVELGRRGIATGNLEVYIGFLLPNMEETRLSILRNAMKEQANAPFPPGKIRARQPTPPTSPGMEGELGKTTL